MIQDADCMFSLRIPQTRKPRRKFKNFQRLMKHDGVHSDSEGTVTDYIFIGDTGEGDTKAGLQMCE